MGKKNKKNQDMVVQQEEIISSENVVESSLEVNKSTLKDLLAPSGIDATHYDYLEIFSKVSRFARTFYLTTIPRQATFPYFLSGIYEFGDVNTSVFITPISETKSQNELNKQIVELQSERYVAHDRGDINRERVLLQKRLEAEELRDTIAAGLNRLFSSTIVATLFAYSMEELDKYTEQLSNEMAKNLIDVKPAWAMQDAAFRTNMPYNDNKLNTYFDISSDFKLEYSSKVITELISYGMYNDAKIFLQQRIFRVGSVNENNMKDTFTLLNYENNRLKIKTR